MTGVQTCALPILPTGAGLGRRHVISSLCFSVTAGGQLHLSVALGWGRGTGSHSSHGAAFDVCFKASSTALGLAQPEASPAPQVIGQRLLLGRAQRVVGSLLRRNHGQIPALPHTGCVALGRPLPSLSLGFLLCRMGMILLLLTFESFCEHWKGCLPSLSWLLDRKSVV